MKRILTAVVRAGNSAASRGAGRAELGTLMTASEVIGDAIGAPTHRRFVVPDRLYHGVIAGNAAEYTRWKHDAYDGLNQDRRIAAFPDEPVYVDSVEDALAYCYSGYSTYGTAYRRDDFQEVLAAVKSRVFKR